jgi:hypothetical protein
LEDRRFKSRKRKIENRPKKKEINIRAFVAKKGNKNQESGNKTKISWKTEDSSQEKRK